MRHAAQARRRPRPAAITIKQDITLRAGEQLHIAAWQREAAGATFLSLAVERAEKGRRR